MIKDGYRLEGLGLTVERIRERLMDGGTHSYSAAETPLIMGVLVSGHLGVRHVIFEELCGEQADEGTHYLAETCKILLGQKNEENIDKSET